jgi:hypothetical protein
MHVIIRIYDKTAAKKNLAFIETEQTCMILLNLVYLVDYKAQLPKPVLVTCTYVLNNPAFLTQKHIKQSNLLWVAGQPGSGKTMVSADRTDYQKPDSATHVKTQVSLLVFCNEILRS